MTDHLTKQQRSWNMSRIRAKNTKPELAIRSALHHLGFRYRIDGRVSKSIIEKGQLPGKPDIVFAKYKSVVFIHGCFWHFHSDCNEGKIPKTNQQYWRIKLHNNVKRDKKNIELCNSMGWRVLTIWECEIENNLDQVINEIINFIKFN